MDALAELAETLSMLARPGIVVEHDDGELVFRIVSPSDPRTDLVVLTARPVNDDSEVGHEAVIRSFNEFNDMAATIVDRATELDAAMVLSQDLYNKGVMLNPYNWIDVFDFRLRHVDLDISHWLRG